MIVRDGCMIGVHFMACNGYLYGSCKIWKSKNKDYQMINFNYGFSKSKIMNFSQKNNQGK